MEEEDEVPLEESGAKEDVALEEDGEETELEVGVFLAQPAKSKLKASPLIRIILLFFIENFPFQSPNRRIG